MSTAASPTPSDPPTAPARLVGLDPRVRLLWRVAAAAAALPVLLLVALADLVVPLPLPLPSGLPTAAAALILGLACSVIPAVRFARWRYALREDDLWIRRGVVWVTTSVIPYVRLQFVDTRQGPLDRLFGLAQLVVHTAAVGTSGHLPGLDAVTAERLREQLSRVEADDSV